jgi:D-glycero-D-manno-heptose 1,7-bisphosphate phosphatase
MKNKKALFIDRDGVINSDTGYVYEQNNFIFKKEIFNIVRLANKLNYLVIIITNQSGIARGFYTEDDFNNLMKWVLNEFKKSNCFIDDIYFCPFHKDGKIPKYTKESSLRKPLPGMINLAATEHNIDIKKSILIGDKMTDISAGHAAGIKINLLLNENKSEYNNIHKKIIYTEISNLMEAENFFK